jgi:hypothetical protein
MSATRPVLVLDRGERPITVAMDPETLFPPEAWYYDPISRKGLPYASVRPCSCGGTLFLFVTRGVGDRDHSVVCEACYRGRFAYRLQRKHDLAYAVLDTRTKTVTATRPVAEVLELRARMPKG